MKRGQIEIIGLLMVVILLSVIIVMALMFLVKPRMDVIAPQRQGIQIISIINTLGETTISSEDITIKEKIEDCSENLGVNPACQDEIKIEIEKILDVVLNKKEYILEIKYDLNTFEIKIPNGKSISEKCSNENPKRNQDSVNILPGRIVTLVLCSK